jgi:hypothetical protein
MEEQEAQLTENWKQVCEIANGLARAYKSRQLYAANNPMRRSCLDTTILALTEFLEEYDTLTFSVTETQLIYRGKPVYANPDRRESPVFRLYRDGIRSLSLHEGITSEELAELLDAIASVNSEGDEGDTDVVTQIWESDLVHVTYIAVDDCLDFDDSELEGSRANGPRGSGPPPRGGSASGTQATGEGAATGVGVSSQEPAFSRGREPSRDYDFSQGAGHVQGERPELAGIEEKVGVATEVRPHSRALEQISVKEVNLSQEELDDIGRRVLFEEAQNPREKVSRVFLNILLGPWSSDVKIDIVRGLGILCGDLLESGNSAQAMNILREVKGLAAEGSKASGELAEAIRSFVEARGSERELERLQPRLEEATLPELEGYEQYLCELPSASIPQLYGLLAKTGRRRAREMLCHVLSRLARENPKLLADLAWDPRWYMVRNLVYVFRLMNDPRVLAHLQGLLSHEDVRVRTEIVRCLSEIGGPQSEELLARLLRDPERAIRVLAVQKLSRGGGELAAAAIADCIQEKSFAGRFTDEKREFFDALGRLGAEGSVPFLERLVVKRSFFQRAEVEETRRFAALALARMGTDRAVRFLEETARRGKGRVRKCCAEALRLRSRSSSVQEEGSVDEAIEKRSDSLEDREDG